MGDGGCWRGWVLHPHRRGLRNVALADVECGEMSATQQAIKLVMPLPPASLSPNGREFWAVRNRDAQLWRTMAAGLIASQRVIGQHDERDWPGARMDIEWRYAGRTPDDDNCVGRLKSTRDGIADAGLVADDGLIHIGAITLVRVPRKDQQVIITLTRIEAA